MPDHGISRFAHGGLPWNEKYGFVGLRDVAPPMVSDGMDEKDPVVGMLLFSGFASYQPFDPPWSQKPLPIQCFLATAPWPEL